MPELPEVETIRLGLSGLLPGLVVLGVHHDWPKSFPNAGPDVDQFLTGAKIVEVTRRGKALILELNTKYSLVIHLKMTGQLVFVGDTAGRFAGGHPNDSLVNRLPDKSTRVIIGLNGGKLYFNDQRKFGWVRLLPTAEIPLIDFFKKLGPEPLSSYFTQREFAERVRRRKNTNIKAALLDQTIVAGIGNIYADESLWAAKIHPQTLVKNLSSAKLNTLFKKIRAVLALALKKGGSTDRNYVDAEGKKGSYLKFAKVFRRQGLPCPRCGKTIEKIRVAGRGTHICLKCQRR